MTTRLDRLVLLLDTGSTASVRATAAQQIGNIQKQHPSELYNLLSRVLVHLKSKNWETRIAAANVKSEYSLENDKALKNKLTFDRFDITDVLRNGKKLLGSAGKEYDIDLNDLDPNERLALQRRNLKQRLGLGSQFMDADMHPHPNSYPQPPPHPHTTPFIKTEPTPIKILPPVKFETSPTGNVFQPPVTMAVEPEPAVDTSGLSARERNRLKRKAKLDAKMKTKEKVRVVDFGKQKVKEEPTSSSVVVKKETSETALVPSKSAQPDASQEKVIVDPRAKTMSGISVEQPSNEWPFEGICDILSMDLFDPTWEVRHGAGLGLREILKCHGEGAGKILGLSKEDNEKRHHLWLEDICIRLLCVFALDRFGDFVSDQVVAPVRETCSQTLGALAKHMSPKGIELVEKCLLQLIHQHEFKAANGNAAGSIWEVRHAGLLGLKYLVAVRKDLVELVINGAVGAVVMGLKDNDDDVRAVSASTLLPIADSFVRLLPDMIPVVLEVLWDCLIDLKDDLTASTASVMDLLARLFSFDEVLKYMQALTMADPQRGLVTLIPRLYPFFRHTITSVRSAVLHTLKTFLGMQGMEGWVDTRCLCLVYQNLLVEEKQDILDLSASVWTELLTHVSRSASDRIQSMFAPTIGSWFSLLMTPLGIPLDTRCFYLPRALITTEVQKNIQDGDQGGFSHNIDVGMIQQDFSLVSQETVVRGRLAGAKAIGMLIAIWPRESLEITFQEIILSFLGSPWALQRQLAAVVTEEWAVAVLNGSINPSITTTIPLASVLSEKLIIALESESPEFYLELVSVLRRIRGECQALLNSFVSDGKLPPSEVPSIPVQCAGEAGSGPQAFSIDVARAIATDTFELLKAKIAPRTRKQILTQLVDRQRRVIASIGFYEATKQQADVCTSAAVSGAVVAFGVLPKKLNPVIRSIMNSIKFEENYEIQQRGATALSNMISICTSPILNLRVNPTDKIIKNLAAFLCSDPSTTPVLQDIAQEDGIYSLLKAKGEQKSSGKGISIASLDTDAIDPKALADEDESVRQAKLVRRGAQAALRELARRFKSDLFQVIPKLWECMCQSLLETFPPDREDLPSFKATDPIGQDVIDCLQVLSAITPFLDEGLHPQIAGILPNIIQCLRSSYMVVRNMAARCMAVMCNCITIPAMQEVIEKILPLLGDTLNVTNRQGAAETIYHVVQTMDSNILPYVIFLIVPVLGRMSDTDESVRVISTNCFAFLIKLVPLEAGIPDPPGIPREMLAHRDKERKFLMQLLDSSKLEPYPIPIGIKAELRSYQQDGVNWLAFLNRYQLHGILCDDMGLGKTLQSICILASDHHMRAEKYKKTKSPDCAHMPSLVVCPPTLTGHWYHEILNYTDNLRPLMYTGGPNERKRLRPKIKKHDIIIMSYDIIRNDIEELSEIHWNYCILDEGHIIKNGKTKITKATKTVKANHRLILSGTPIQNNVLELWSLFDFLMPGFLGTEKLFNERFGKPILASKDSKSSSRDQEAGALALEALHKQVLPFLLRRLKEDVLDDLPPKIIQDYYCELSDLQKQLYEDFAKSQATRSLQSNWDDEQEEEKEESETGKKKATHIFQALQYLRKLCNHPLLVVNPKHPEYNKVMSVMETSKSSPHDLQHAPKLQALRQLLLDCGIGVTAEAEASDPMSGGAVSQHRALIFCQLKTMLDIIENDLLKNLMPSVTYMRLDGSVDASKRHGIVQKFNQDPSIDVLLLTTHVGGLGLNLTGADTVIFVEHDWNPMKDLQAMDRAHRIGQKKVVNVYRLITRGTLEEKIMGLQKFKLNIANSIVNQQNSGLQSMDTDQILDLFNVTPTENTRPKKSDDPSSSKKLPQKAILENLENLWDEKQYDEEYNLDHFIESLK
ncbi:hypothetical protein K493DRAFT_316207 [Basidiobolus meristosporus CBS 931.73]|uniref:TATA-binding protein-associated factor mot1 n=1 Tax=Basidiobolus meristosporus CBS 931.73 TaxID=1314790 RepID=A0A1Y1Y4S9_9FUNG|nr:hypothetical protein K493DRAFT_316207 [Basidiobolus meristosporus CBS 931.73]|eukprot:ORX93031.1 hypothetical protein K493DRAFT_316207 [Basidiobolus meristosporus CBS 931.73]